MVPSIRLERGGKGTSQFKCGQQDVDKFATGISTNLGVSSDNGTWKQDAKKRFELRSTGQQNTPNTIFEKAYFQYPVTAKEE